MLKKPILMFMIGVWSTTATVPGTPEILSPISDSTRVPFSVVASSKPRNAVVQPEKGVLREETNRHSAHLTIRLRFKLHKLILERVAVCVDMGDNPETGFRIIVKREKGSACMDIFRSPAEHPFWDAISENLQDKAFTGYTTSLSVELEYNTGDSNSDGALVKKEYGFGLPSAPGFIPRLLQISYVVGAMFNKSSR